MTKNKKHQKVSPQTQEDAMKVARATQRPGQTKEQTKLIALGIEKGINQYKKQQKEKSRDLNRKLQKASKAMALPAREALAENEVEVIYKRSLLPWFLLGTSWLIFIAYFLVTIQ